MNITRNIKQKAIFRKDTPAFEGGLEPREWYEERTELKITNCDINITPTTKKEVKVWVKDEQDEDGGYYQWKTKRTKARLRVEARLVCENRFRVNSMYSDGVNTWMAVNENTLINFSMLMDVFAMPKEVVYMYNVFSSTTANP